MSVSTQSHSARHRFATTGVFPWPSVSASVPPWRRLFPAMASTCAASQTMRRIASTAGAGRRRSSAPRVKVLPSACGARAGRGRNSWPRLSGAKAGRGRDRLLGRGGRPRARAMPCDVARRPSSSRRPSISGRRRTMRSMPGMRRYFAAVGRDLRDVILYHIPSMTGVPISHGVIRRLRRRNFPAPSSA